MATRVRTKSFARTFTVSDISVLDGRELTSLTTDVDEWLKTHNLTLEGIKIHHIRQITQFTLPNGSPGYHVHYEDRVMWEQVAGINY